MLLPPLPHPFDKLRPIPALAPLMPALKPLAPLPPMAPVEEDRRKGNRVDGDAGQGFVQVLLEEPDDALAMQMMRAAGVVFATAKSIIPRDGVLTCHSPAGKGDMYAYRWRG